MTHSKLLTFQDLMDELDMGKATLKFILQRFSPWLDTQAVNDETCYNQQCVDTLLNIKNMLDSGLLPGQIEDSFVQKRQANQAWLGTQPASSDMTAGPVDMQSASMFKDMLSVFIEKQDRIAMAQEALAQVEARKADAMEKRAVAEEKKADAMTNIALALQALNQRHSTLAPDAVEIAGKTVETLALEEACDFDESLLDLDTDLEVPTDAPMNTPMNTKDIMDEQDQGDCRPSPQTPDMDDLSSLTDDNTLSPEDIDDLSALIDSVSDSAQDMDDLVSLLDEPQAAPGPADDTHDLDNLSKLIGNAPGGPDVVDPSPEPAADLDDLSRLVDMGRTEDMDDLVSLVQAEPETSGKTCHQDLDDLSKLIDAPGGQDMDDLDDLSALIGPSQSGEPMDDLSALVGNDPKDDAQAEPVDDLWSLISDTKDTTEKSSGPAIDPGMDDLSALLNNPKDSGKHKEADAAGTNDAPAPSKDTPSIKPDISPDQDMGKYKAAVMKIIIELKDKGLLAQQTTDRLNNDDVATLSGKPSWSLKAIEKIYGFIDSAK